MLGTEARSDGDQPDNALLRAEDGFRRLAGAFLVPGGAALVALVVLTVGDALSRHVFDRPWFGVDALSQMALAAVVASAIAYGATDRSHVRVNLIARLAGPRVTGVTDIAARLVGLAGAAFTAFALVAEGSCGRECGAVTTSIEIVHTPFYYLLASALGLYALLLAVRLVVRTPGGVERQPAERR